VTYSPQARQGHEKRAIGITLAAVCMAVGGGLLWVEQRDISLGTAYAV